jgi:hypothetical protein
VRCKKQVRRRCVDQSPTVLTMRTRWSDVVRFPLPLQKQTASLTHQIEADMAGRASGGGPLTIMKELGEKVKAENEREHARKVAKAKAKVRA